MLKIGEFARLSQVTIDTLRHYDEIDLLQPAHIDPTTNYRYYTLEQLADVHRIMALKELGLSLEEIDLMLHEALDVEQIRGMLRLKQAEIQQQVREGQRRLAMVEFRLRLLEAEENPPDLDVVMKRLPLLRVLVLTPIRKFTDPVAGTKAMERAINIIHQSIAAGDIRFAGISLSVFRGDEIPELPIPDEGWLVVDDDQQDDVELVGLRPLVLREEPGVETAATLMAPGLLPFEMYEKTSLLMRWAVAHDYSLCNITRWLHYRGPLNSPAWSEWVTEIQVAVDPPR